MNGDEQLSPRNGDSLVVDDPLLASGRTPVVVVVKETKIKVKLSKKEKSESSSPQRSPRLGDSVVVSNLLNTNHNI